MSTDFKLNSVLLHKGITLLKIGNYKEGIEIFDEILSADPSYYDAWYYKGKAYRDLGESENAILCLDKAIEINPKFREAVYLRNQISHSLGESIDKNYDNNQIASPIVSESERLNDLGVNYYNMADYDTAIQYFNKALEVDPNSTLYYNNIVLAFYYKGDYDKTIEYCKKAIEIDPKNTQAHTYIGHSYLQKRDYYNALQIFEKILQLSLYKEDLLTTANTLYNMAIIHMREEKLSLEKSLSLLHQALRIYEKIGNKLGIAKCYHNIGVLYEKDNNFYDALKALDLAEQYYTPIASNSRDPFLMKIYNLRKRITTKLNDFRPSIG